MLTGREHARFNVRAPFFLLPRGIACKKNIICLEKKNGEKMKKSIQQKRWMGDISDSVYVS